MIPARCARLAVTNKLYMLIKIYLITLLVSSLIAIYHFKKLTGYLQLFSILILSTFAVECVGYFLIRTNNAWMFNIFTIVEFVFYLSIFRHIIYNKAQKKLLLTLMISYVIASLANILFFQGFFKFNNYSYSYGCMLVCTAVVMYFFQLLHHSNPQPLTQLPMFWIGTGLLLYYACNFFYMGLVNYLISVSLELATELFTLMAVLNIIMYSLFSVGIICSITQRKSS